MPYLRSRAAIASARCQRTLRKTAAWTELEVEAGRRSLLGLRPRQPRRSGHARRIGCSRRTEPAQKVRRIDHRAFGHRHRAKDHVLQLARCRARGLVSSAALAAGESLTLARPTCSQARAMKNWASGRISSVRALSGGTCRGETRSGETAGPGETPGRDHLIKGDLWVALMAHVDPDLAIAPDRQTAVVESAATQPADRATSRRFRRGTHGAAVGKFEQTRRRRAASPENARR